MPQKLDFELTCPKCGKIYLRIPKTLTYTTMIHCSLCETPLGTWRELEDSFIIQGGYDGVFELKNGQIVKKDD